MKRIEGGTRTLQGTPQGLTALVNSPLHGPLAALAENRHWWYAAVQASAAAGVLQTCT